MKIGIIAAMDEELELLLNKANINKKENKASMVFNSGNIYDKEVVLVRCGIGKVNASVCAQILADDFDVTHIINVGVAGGIGKDIMPGDVVVADNLVHHDVDTSALGDKIGQVPRLDTYEFKCDEKLVDAALKSCENFSEAHCFKGRIISGDQFIADAEKIKWFENEFHAEACEMEGASIGQVCYLNSIPFVVIRSISDNANNGAHMDFEKFTPIGVKNSTTILENMLKIL
ncbi:MAG: 5'-methylthioadenosine/adenosylhomocysteine nucleosidase [Clostridium sp.]|nr:5'-methylthioadenosine/adenosylhomocysteine nucleosidase [Clostridium sp.]